MAPRVMVVGGTGNMSTAIVRLLVERGYDVSIYCRGQSVLPPHPDARVVIEHQNLIPDSDRYPGEDEIIRLQLATRH